MNIGLTINILTIDVRGVTFKTKVLIFLMRKLISDNGSIMTLERPVLEMNIGWLRHGMVPSLLEMKTVLEVYWR
jgi:hypothetical protein